MKQINKITYLFLHFITMWFIVSLSNNSIYIEDWTWKSILFFWFIYLMISMIILSAETESLFKLSLPLIIFLPILYIIFSIACSDINCITWKDNVKDLFGFLALSIYPIITAQIED